MNCQFSETQFVMGYLGEYFNRYRAMYPNRNPPFSLPTTSVEPILGSDFILVDLSYIEFYQFKRSHYIRTRRGDAEINAGIPKSFRPYYRFEIYNDSSNGSIPQFDRLRDIARLHPRFRTFYCAPKFYTNREFQEYFWRQQIIDNSAIIDCNQFNQTRFRPPHFNIDDGDRHFMVYNDTSNRGYLCSEMKEFNLTHDILKEIKEDRIENDDGNENTNSSGEELINKLFFALMELDETSKPNIKDQNSPAEKLAYSINLLFTKCNIVTQLKFK
ncbi:hypothetical protein GZ212_13070 [Mangrovimonas sp. CR14]|uniref:hypothetical protein n=1 Tax=Mangrovimonas sp. CR14 TaxID=2706120 RepID=UPI00142399CC|nr:hypothetical protein [Mangrovimonas sp. CR14]NIK93088.1 hypothetical protein [Mangrovimonas sp. CR14]